MMIRAYNKRVDHQAWLNGQYNYIALKSIASELFRDKKSKIMPYPEKPYSTQEGENNSKVANAKAPIKEEDREQAFIDLMQSMY